MSPRPYRPAPPRQAPGRAFVTVEEAAQEMRVSKMTVYRLIERGQLSAIRVGRSVRIYENALQDFLNAALIGGDEL